MEKTTNKPFQIHTDEPDGTGPKKPLATAEPLKAEPVDSPLPINNAVAQLRQPLATIEIPSAMDVSFGKRSRFSNTFGHLHKIHVSRCQTLNSQNPRWICLWSRGVRSLLMLMSSLNMQQRSMNTCGSWR